MTFEGERELEEDEGRRKFPYDDATGKPLKAGDIIRGNITIGVGRNLSAQGLANDEIEFCFKNNIRDFEEFLFNTFPDWNKFSPRRQDALINMCFNEGNTGFLGFQLMIMAIKAGDWETAAKECLSSKAGRDLPGRYTRIANDLRDG